MITKDQATMLKQLSLNVVCTSGKYDALQFTESIKEKRLAWEEMAKATRTLNDYIDSLVAQ